MDNGAPLLSTEEYPLFTDARITGEAEHGPYSFLNTVPLTEGKIRPAIMLRLANYVNPATPDMTKTKTDVYHGSSFPDEIAALASLALGVRFRASGPTRRFEPGGDPKGRPFDWVVTPRPVRLGTGGMVMPEAIGTHSLDQLAILNSLPALSAVEAVVLVRAARLYQDALWIVEPESELAWLMLVSAVETIANQWRRTAGEPADRLKFSRPELYQLLEQCGQDILNTVAKEIAETLGSGKKFSDFIIEFLPLPPSLRPPVWSQHSWDKDQLRRTFRLIYGYRSKALHDGRPFPAPMCEVPYEDSGWSASAEKPIGLATSAGGGTWLAIDAPMLFHTFEYIARNAILEWWRRGVAKHVTNESNSA